MKKYFCSSDIHSFYTKWMEALSNNGFDKDNSDHIVIICGDLFDRGEESIDCFNFVKELAENNRLVYVTGNHEDLLFDCITDIYRRNVGSHHIHNGTLKTLSQFMNCSVYDLLNSCYDKSKFDEVVDTLTTFIQNNCLNYFDLGDKVFVHGWVPSFAHVDDYHDASSSDWGRARWENGFEMWRNKQCRPDNKIVVIGHWHCSYGWSHIDMKYKEFPQKTHVDFDKVFRPWIREGIIAIDACTAYSGHVNVVVFDDKGNLINKEDA